MYVNMATVVDKSLLLVREWRGMHHKAQLVVTAKKEVS